MKKKILFVIPSLRGGGAEKSLISVLSLFDYEKYEVDLLLFRRDGLFFEKIPKEINYLYDTSDYEMFDGNGANAVKYFAEKFKFLTAFERIKYSRIFKAQNESVGLTAWNFLKKTLPDIKKKYDCAIGYLEGNSNSFVIENVNADRKICYIHNDINKLPHDKSSYRSVIQKADAVVTVSQVCLDSLKNEFPDFENKFHVVENITSRQLILADAWEEKVFDVTDDTAVLLTVGRFSEQKNIELAVEACRELKDRSRKIKWYHIGTGDLKDKVQNLVSELDLNDDFIMLGEKSNPYPYMVQCDVYVQPSRFEGKSIAIDEVKCLCKPIVVTDFPSVYDQIKDGVNGVICKMDKVDMADKIELLLDDAEMKNTLCRNLSEEKTGNEDELEKLYKLIDG